MYLAKHPENLNNFNLSRPRYRSATLPKGEGICPTNGNWQKTLRTGQTQRCSVFHRPVSPEVSAGTARPANGNWQKKSRHFEVPALNF